VHRSNEKRWRWVDLVVARGTLVAGEDMAAALDTARARRAGEEHRRVNVDFPAWMVAELDREAIRLGVTRQSLIKVWIAEKLDHGDHTAA